MAEILSNIKLSSLQVSETTLQPAPVNLSNTGNVILTSSDHAGRVLTFYDQTANNRAYVLPKVERGGDKYEFVYVGNARMAKNIVFRTLHSSASGETETDSDTFMRGAVTLVDTRAGTSNLVVAANSTNHSNLNISRPEALNLCFVSSNTSTTNPAYIVSGIVSSTGQANAVSFSNN